MPYVDGLFDRDLGSCAPPIVILHGGWGYGFEAAVARVVRDDDDLYAERASAATCTRLVREFVLRMA